MGEGPIPWTAINDYAIRNGLSNEQHDDLQYIMAVLDDAYFSHKNEVRERENAAKARKGPQVTQRRGKR